MYSHISYQEVLFDEHYNISTIKYFFSDLLCDNLAFNEESIFYEFPCLPYQETF